MMQYKYYIGTGPEAETIIEDCRNKYEARNQAVADLRQRHGVDYFLELQGRLVQVGFDSPPEDWKKWLCGMEKRNDNGKPVYCFYPRKNTKRGKELAREMEEEKYVFDYNKFLVNAAGMGFTAMFGNVFSSSVACYNKDRLLVRVPYGDSFYDTQKIPCPPAWLREVTLSEFEAAQNKPE